MVLVVSSGKVLGSGVLMPPVVSINGVDSPPIGPVVMGETVVLTEPAVVA